MFLLSTYYRAPINFSPANLEIYGSEWERVRKSVASLFRILDRADALAMNVNVTDPEIAKTLADFDAAMEDDFNTPNALTALSAIVKIDNILLRGTSDHDRMNQALSASTSMLSVLGLDPSLKRLTAEERSLFVSWETARKAKDFAAADGFRAELAKRGLL
jgi:cysteinyl-tRNA synthetase